METLNKIWEFLDGKKTVIGFIIVVICGDPNLGNYLPAYWISVLHYVGTSIGGVGIGHKLLKR
jgi:hypothetical protein